MAISWECPLCGTTNETAAGDGLQYMALERGDVVARNLSQCDGCDAIFDIELVVAYWEADEGARVKMRGAVKDFRSMRFDAMYAENIEG